MKLVIALALVSLFSVSSHAIALRCAPDENHLFNAEIVKDESGQCSHGLRINLNAEDVNAWKPCAFVQTYTKPGLYQLCGRFAGNVFVVAQAVDARLR